MTGSDPILEIRDVNKAFGGVQALDRIGFNLENASITGLIGPNGAGKTTLFNVITGMLAPDTGDIRFAGRSIEKLEVHQRVALGIARTFQNVELFESMTVLDNILVGLFTRTRAGMIASMLRLPRTRKEETLARDQAMELLNFVGLQDYAHRKSGDLPFGWQRMLEVARAMAAQPRLLLLDEPAAGLNMAETGHLGELIKEIRSRGITILLVEHDMSLTMSISDHIVVLDQGGKIAEGPPRAVQADEAVMAAYLGKKATPTKD
ncbi:MAG: ABC transporter ATP-binding protein [Desulfobacterales bacterium]|nr:ABC transporter ATP-binding protein [Desulfobacterales bacterium]